MPRSARRASPSGIDHIMLRGIDRQDIFLEDEDRLRFLQVLRQCRQICGFQLYAYCLMTNHVHLLMKAGHEPLELIFKRIGCRYVYWYNRKYQRTGHLFQDRFRSEPIENDSHFQTVLRYILQNPMKAGMERAPGHYRWSSYSAYAGKEDQLTDTSLAREMFASRAEMLAFFAEESGLCAMDMPERAAVLSDKDAEAIFREMTNCADPGGFHTLDRLIQRRHFAELRKAGLSVAQITALSGASKATVSRYSKP